MEMNTDKTNKILSDSGDDREHWCGKINMKLNPLFINNNISVKFHGCCSCRRSYTDICICDTTYQTFDKLFLVKSYSGYMFYLNRDQAIKLDEKIKKSAWSIAWKHIRIQLVKWCFYYDDVPNYIILTDYQFDYINNLRVNSWGIMGLNKDHWVAHDKDLNIFKI